MENNLSAQLLRAVPNALITKIAGSLAGMRLVQFLGTAIWFCCAHSHVPEILCTFGCQLSSQGVAHHEQAWAQSCRLQTLVRGAKAWPGNVDYLLSWRKAAFWALLRSWKQTWPQQEEWTRSDRPGQGGGGCTTVLSLQLVNTISKPLDLIWSPAGGRGSNLLGQGLQSWSLKSFVSEGFWQQHSKKLSAELPKMDARLSFHGPPVFVSLISLKWKQLIVMLSSSAAFSVVF